MAPSSRDRRKAPAPHARERHWPGLGPAPRPEIGPAKRPRAGDTEAVRPGRPFLSRFASSPSVPASGGIAADAQILSLSSERREILCSVIGLSVKIGLVAVAGVSLFRLAAVYQQRMERQGEINAVLELQSGRLSKARERFDSLFMVEGEQRLIREQSQWIAPNRLRVVWQNRGTTSNVATASVPSTNGRPAGPHIRP